MVEDNKKKEVKLLELDIWHMVSGLDNANN